MTPRVRLIATPRGPRGTHVSVVIMDDGTVHIPSADPVCSIHKDEYCLGPDVAANQGGCRMDTWSDI